MSNKSVLDACLFDCRVNTTPIELIAKTVQSATDSVQIYDAILRKGEFITTTVAPKTTTSTRRNSEASNLVFFQSIYFYNFSIYEVYF
jgi:hypothetical protein